MTDAERIKTLEAEIRELHQMTKVIEAHAKFDKTWLRAALEEAVRVIKNDVDQDALGVVTVEDGSRVHKTEALAAKWEMILHKTKPQP